MPNDIEKVNTIINDLCEGFSKKYGYTIFNIEVKELKNENSITLTGSCLTKKQLNTLKRKLRSSFSTKKVLYDINVLVDAHSQTEPKLYGTAGKNVVNIFSGYSTKKLSTQITPQDNPFKIILRKAGKSLILLDDNTLGWAGDRDIKISDKDFSKSNDIKMPEKGGVMSVDSISPLFLEASAFIDKVKYLHGGRSSDGVDCSALIQMLFKKAFNIVMPRHTLDQMKCGIRVPKSGIKSGDLVFARMKENKIMHAGLAFFDKEMMVIHSCLRKKIVVSEDIESFFKHYSFAGARRVIKEKTQ
jgi:cell wall-associated NlpC family hydrolase